MGEIILVRHGQANSAADNEDDYDKLSDLGHQQAKWLGEWMRTHEAPFDTVMSGTLRRQRETLDGLGYPDAPRDARLNEIAYYDLTDEMETATGLKRSTPRTWPRSPCRFSTPRSTVSMSPRMARC